MSQQSSSGKILAIVGGIVIGLLLVCGIGAAGMYKVIQDRKAQRKADLKSVDDLAQAALKIKDGKDAGNVQFPDTPIGHMNKIVFGFLQESQQIAGKFQTSLDKIGWDQIGELKGRDKKEGVQKDLDRIASAKRITAEFSDSFERSLDEVKAALEDESRKSSDGESFYRGFTNSLNKPTNSISITRETLKALKANHDALEAQYEFLLKRIGHYKIDNDTILFDAAVSQREVDEFNKLATKVDETIKKVQALDQQQQLQMDQALNRLNDLGKR